MFENDDNSADLNPIEIAGQYSYAIKSVYNAIITQKRSITCETIASSLGMNIGYVRQILAPGDIKLPRSLDDHEKLINHLSGLLDTLGLNHIQATLGEADSLFKTFSALLKSKPADETPVIEDDSKIIPIGEERLSQHVIRLLDKYSHDKKLLPVTWLANIIESRSGRPFTGLRCLDGDRVHEKGYIIEAICKYSKLSESDKSELRNHYESLVCRSSVGSDMASQGK